MREELQSGPGLSTANAAQDLTPHGKGLPEMVANAVAPPASNPEIAQRLVVDLNRRTRADLAWLCEIEELNKTTVVNRAVQVYRMLRDAQERGGTVAVNGENLLFF